MSTSDQCYNIEIFKFGEPHAKRLRYVTNPKPLFQIRHKLPVCLEFSPELAILKISLWLSYTCPIYEKHVIRNCKLTDHQNPFWSETVFSLQAENSDSKVGIYGTTDHNGNYISHIENLGIGERKFFLTFYCLGSCVNKLLGNKQNTRGWTLNVSVQLLNDERTFRQTVPIQVVTLIRSPNILHTDRTSGGFHRVNLSSKEGGFCQTVTIHKVLVNNLLKDGKFDWDSTLLLPVVCQVPLTKPRLDLLIATSKLLSFRLRHDNESLKLYKRRIDRALLKIYQEDDKAHNERVERHLFEEKKTNPEPESSAESNLLSL